MEDPAIDEEDVEPRFVLFGPAMIAAGPAFLEMLSLVLGQLRPAAFVLRNGSIERDFDRVSGIRSCVRDHGLALLSEDDFSIEMGGDGFHLTDAGKVDVSRFGLTRDLPAGANVGDHYLFGADAGYSRHDAMTAGEGGADYVAFGELDRAPDDGAIELIRWWHDLAEVPCLGHAAGPNDVASLVEAGADFIGVSAAIWDHVESPAIAARDMSVALENSIGRKT